MSRLFVILALAQTAAAEERIKFEDVAGSNSVWQQATAIVDAPAEQVRFWLTDYQKWPERFSDVEAAQTLGKDDQGANVVIFRSRIAERTLTIHETVTPECLIWWGTGKDLYVQGRIWMLPRGARKTEVIMQSSSEVKGFLKIFATRSMKRRISFDAMRSNMESLFRLADGI